MTRSYYVTFTKLDAHGFTYRLAPTDQNSARRAVIRLKGRGFLDVKSRLWDGPDNARGVLVNEPKGQQQ